MNIKDTLILQLERLLNMIDEIEERNLNGKELSNLTVRQIYYLDLIAKLKEPTLSDLANAFKVSKPTVTIAVNKLIENGYVFKEQAIKDKRVFHVILTEKGKKVVTLHNQAHKEFVLHLLNSLNVEEQEQLVKLFHKII